MNIRGIWIKRWMGLEAFEWQPSPGINCLIGPGDSGKSSLLAAISLLLSPRPANAASEFDYFKRRVSEGFEIRAALADFDPSISSAMRVPAFQGWKSGKLADLPDEDGAEPVLVVRVRGTPELEVVHEIEYPSNEVAHFSVAARQKLLLARVGGGDRAIRELRLGQGSLLDRHVGKVDLRASLSAAVANASSELKLPEYATSSVEELKQLFEKSGLPGDLSLGIITPYGSSLISLIGLLSGADPKEAIPLFLAGAGTRQMVLFRLTMALAKQKPLLVLDEPETGLEPYRQNALIKEVRELVGEQGQAFLTTHSPTILRGLHSGEVYRLTGSENPVRLQGNCVERLLRRAPDAFLAALPVLMEGETELGAIPEILAAKAADKGLGDLEAMGCSFADGSGQPGALQEASELLNLGLSCGVFVDNEDTHAGTRAALAANPKCAFGSWDGTKNIEAAVALHLPLDEIPKVLALAASVNSKKENDYIQALNGELGKPGRKALPDLVSEYGESTVRLALASVMSERAWFKKRSRGVELGRLLLKVGLPPAIDGVVARFLDRLVALSA